jgi:hypothetical protein
MNELVEFVGCVSVFCVTHHRESQAISKPIAVAQGFFDVFRYFNRSRDDALRKKR